MLLKNYLIIPVLFLVAVFIGSPVSAHYIHVDGDDSDWIGVTPGTDSFIISADEAIWNDALDDDSGDGGDAPGASDNPSGYTYPTDAQFLGTEADLDEFRITVDSSPDSAKMFFLIKMKGFDQNWMPFVTVLMDFDMIPGSGQTDCGGYSDALVNQDIAWEYALYVRNGNISVKDSNFNDVVSEYNSNYYSAENNLIEVGLDLSKFDYSPVNHKFRVVVFSGLQDYENMRDVDYEASQWKGGGGLDSYFNPKIYDMGFVSSGSQHLDLDNYTDSSKTVIRSSSAQLIDLRTDVENMSWGKIKAGFAE